MKKHVVSAVPARQGEKPLALVIEEKYDQVRQLINMGKERGCLLYDEVNNLLPAEVLSSEEIHDRLSAFKRYGIDVYEDVSIAEEAEVDLTPGRLEKTNDPVRMYLREMGT